LVRHLVESAIGSKLLAFESAPDASCSICYAKLLIVREVFPSATTRVLQHVSC
jgi:hypothetical protein